jgi:hypothetical protein
MGPKKTRLKTRLKNEAPSQAGFAPPEAVKPDAGAAPPRYTWDPPEPLFSEAMIQAKGMYGRARPNPAFKSFSPPKWRRAYIWAALAAAFAALLATGGVLIALELLVYPARVLPWRPTVAILARVERVFFPLAVATVCLMLYQFIRDKLEEFVPA